MSVKDEKPSESNPRVFSVDFAAETGSSNPRLTEKYNVDVREFVVLACLGDIGVMNARSIASQVGLSLTTTDYCLESLERNELIEPNDDYGHFFNVTEDGRMLIRKSRLAGFR